MTKTDITNTLHKALDKTHKVLTSNSKNRIPNGLKAITDHIIINRFGAGIVWLEVKLGNDRLSEEQKEFKQMIETQERKSKGVIKYRMVTDADSLADVIQEIYGK